MNYTNAKFQHVIDLKSHVGDKEVFAHAVCFDGSLAILLGDDSGTEQAFGVPSGAGYSLSCLRVCDGVVQETELAANTSRFPKVQVFADGSILVVGARSNEDQNASVYSVDGALLRQFRLGDGIEDVQVSRSGELWVSYFDEGVYGNTAWQHNSSAHSGLCCFDNNGSPIWEFHPPSGFGVIDDCYAMAVVGDEVFVCYYSYFPVVRITATKKVEGWKNKIAGARAIAVIDTRVVLYGGYSGERTRCVVQEFGSDHELKNARTLELDIPGGLENAYVTGRGSSFYALADLSWYQLDLSKFV